MRHGASLCLATLTLIGLGACVREDTVAQGNFAPSYGGIETILLDGDLVDFRVAMQGARGNDDVEAYARCAAAQYALIRGAGFARHVRTTVARDGNTWRGDAVYTISASLPKGFKTIDAEVTVRDCGDQGIPTV
jgi:hypothetical protein